MDEDTLIASGKEVTRRVIRGAGYEILRGSDDPILRTLVAAYNQLRMSKLDSEAWRLVLPRLASLSHLRATLLGRGIDLVIDVGANCGQFARDLRSVGFAGEIISFEPLAKYREHLQRQAETDGRWRCFAFALGHSTEERLLNVYRDDSFSSVHSINEAGQEQFGALVDLVDVERVEMRKLDDISEELGISSGKRILLKTDTQGHDADVIRGARQTLRNVTDVLTEATVRSIYGGTSTLDEMSKILLDEGFAHGGMFPIAYVKGAFELIEMDCYFTRVEAGKL